ncbi:RNA helicase [Branchiibius sp. NY16-3462-2]|uniref:DEAD/DEAH box helicase n=1 Tax=Branchiibius sp. NY16-3462-2 TaxID=1807500 RepID=UPI000792EE59|nr:DEAD/DEAH box helicase [Branchiibius sp. NY16-3462-2]KYH42941.1 DEAD/DEAH box helicase [Branchiibius sp. NY16-3462-2]
MTLTDAIPSPADPDALYAVFTAWVRERGLTPYPHQEEAVLELLSGANVILATPTGSGKSLVAQAACFMALAADRVSFYTAPIKALVSEKFFEMVSIFGADNVGMITGDASVNADAPIICCTAEILANIALREGGTADVGLVVMDEFHFYSEPDRGWAWQVPLLELPQAQFLLMSATLGDVTRFEEDLTARTGRPTATITGVDRPVPLSYAWSVEPLPELLAELIKTDQAPAYVVHFTQAAALEQARSLLTTPVATKEQRAAIAARIVDFRFNAGFGKTLNQLVRHGIGVHHAGMLPKYRRLVEQLAQEGLLPVICGTDTLGVGINVPIRTVVFTGLAKFDGSRQRILKAREFHQIAGRAGRAGFDTSGTVIVQAPEHVIEFARAVARAGNDAKKLRKVQRSKPAEGEVIWSEETFDKLVAAEPEPLQSRMQINHSMMLNLIAREGDPFTAVRRLLRDNHEDTRRQVRLTRQAIALYRELLASGVVRRLDQPLADGRQVELVTALQDSFALNQPLAPFALAALDLLDETAPDYALDVVSVIEAILEDPRPILLAQRHKARGIAIGQMKADGIEYDERMELLEEISWPQPLAELLEAAFETYRSAQPWVPLEALSPKSVVREMYENAWSFGDLIAQYQIGRSEGVVLRYLSDAYRTLRDTVPDARKTPELTDVIEWLGETVRQTDSSLLDEWEALLHPSEAAGAQVGGPPPPPRRFTATKAFEIGVRNAMWRRLELAARRDVDGLLALEANLPALTDPPVEPVMDAEAWRSDLGAYYAEHEEIVTDADARNSSYLQVERQSEAWLVRQVIADPQGDRDWGIDGYVDLLASDHSGQAIILVQGLNRFDHLP